MQQKKRLPVMIMSILLACMIFNVVLAEQNYREYWQSKRDRASRANVLVPQSERLCDLGYLGESTPRKINGDNANEVFAIHYAAFSLFSQVMRIPHQDGVISARAQEELFSDIAATCPIPVPGYDTQKLFDIDVNINKSLVGLSVYEYVTIAEIEKLGAKYNIMGIYSGAGGKNYNVKIQYQKPDHAPELLVGDKVLVLGHLTSVYGYNDPIAREIQAVMVAFAANE